MAFDPTTFFTGLGLVARPLFGGRVNELPRVETARRDLIFLDGVAASFALAFSDRPFDANDAPFYNWAWSSNVGAHVEVAALGNDGVVLVRRWDAPGRVRRFSLRSVEQFGGDFLGELEKDGPPRAPSAVSRALYLFQVIRDLTSDTAGVTALRAFHGLLRAAARVSRLQPAAQREWKDARILADALAPEERADIPASALEARLYNVHTQFIDPDPTTGRSLNADLLLRHAAGALYQEAHLDIQRAKLLQLPLLAGTAAKMPVSRGEVVFTPPGLARVMVEKAVQAVREPDGSPAQPSSLRVLDPACGSGVFLVETLLSEIDLAGTTHRKIELAGFDLSEAAVEMAKLAISDAATEVPAGVAVANIQCADALGRNWPEVDVVLMNPPFVAWQDLTEDQRVRVREICGTEQGGRPDLAMAFVTKALAAVRPGGVVATVLPSALLGTESGAAWRETLAASTDVLVVGRFRGSDIFPTALVEPSILLLRKRLSNEISVTPAVFVLSRPGGGDAALRALRSSPAARDERFDLYEVPPAELSRGSWLPRPFRLRSVAQMLERRALTRVADVFDVHQGIRTGNNEVFVLGSEELHSLPKNERRFFRPLAGNKTIRRGQLTDSEYVFYPYSPDSGMSLATEEQLRKAVPTYFRERLLPTKKELTSRARVTEKMWWRLSEPRAWQFEREPKLVSSYFGGSGKFALDETGDFVVGQGYAWVLKAAVEKRGRGKILDAWRESALCYLALLNSRTFEALLSYYSYHVMGGQLDLSPRFVNRIPIPDFVTGSGSSADVAAKLRHYGRRIAGGSFDDVGSPEFEEVAALAFGARAEDFSIGDHL
jgi:adenine-specific DNA-methyltransferase